MFESIEPRTLMSCGGWHSGSNSNRSFSDGTWLRMHDGDLTISSTNKDQNLVITELDSTTVPASNQPGTFLIQNLVTGEEFTLTGVDDVEIDTGKGNDSIFFSGKSAVAHIHSGDGADIITLLDRGRDSSDIDAGRDNDQINVIYSRRAQIDAGSGDDVISLQTAAAIDPTRYDFKSARVTVDAGSGHDTFIAYAGQVYVYNARSDDTFSDLSGGNAFHKLDFVHCGGWS